MEFGQLMEAAGLTEDEQKELKDYIYDEGLAELMHQVAEQVQVVPHSERALFDALPYSYVKMTEEEVDQETDELNDLFHKSILNAHQIQLTSYMEQICNNMLFLQDLEPYPLHQEQYTVMQQEFNDSVQEYNQSSKTVIANYEGFIEEYNHNKSLLNIFQPNLLEILESQQNVYKTLIKNLETAMDADLKKNNDILKEANRLAQQIQNLRIKNFLMNQLNMKESYLKYNKLDKTSLIQLEFGDAGASVNTANLQKMLRSLQEENIRLNALFIQTQKNVLPNSVYQVQKQILYQFSADQQYHLSQFKLAHNFIKDGQLKLNNIINSNNGILELITEVVNDAQGTFQWLKDQQNIIQTIIMQLRENKEKLSAVSQAPITYLGLDKILEPLLEQRIETPGQALGAYETKLNEEIIDKTQYDAENMTKRQVFRKRRIIECLQSLKQENAKIFGIIEQVNQILSIYARE